MKEREREREFEVLGGNDQIKSLIFLTNPFLSDDLKAVTLRMAQKEGSDIDLRVIASMSLIVCTWQKELDEIYRSRSL
jgi:hypothetical protein